MTEFQIIKNDSCHVKSGHVRATIVVTAKKKRRDKLVLLTVHTRRL